MSKLAELRDDISSNLRKIAKEKNLPLCDYFDFFAREIQTDDLYSGDHIHQNAHGYFTMRKFFLREQGLDFGEEKVTPPDYLQDWCKKVSEKIEIYGGELMIVQNYDEPLEEKLKIADEYARTRTDVNPRLIEIANNYVRLKPNQAQILKEVNELYAKNVLNR